ncbi:SMI1/KNR4 family protein [Kitasatospora sp. NPDC004745]|uniref:SMI1/KNR4 family protein n=1 Tax=Kitasatospora sp. NPDC004745 TaxID=3364019 RepID=UPI0036BEA046
MTDQTTTTTATAPAVGTASATATAPAVGTASATAARLHRLAEASGGLVALDPGIDDARMDAWPVPVPEEVRALLRSVGGVRVTVSRSAVNGHESHEHVDLDHAYNRGRYANADVSWYQDHAGGVGTHWFVHTDHGDGHTYVDVDPRTGAWGPVFRFWDAADTDRMAPSLTAWLDHLADCLEQALAATGTRGTAADVGAFGRRFGDLWPDGDRRTTSVEDVTAARLRTSGDDVLRAAAEGLPDDARLADLRSVTGRAAVDFWAIGATCRYARLAGGGVLVALPWDGE